ncbi:hypothetical protein VTN77DRAFT_713 [Rasamsonia byssochlamydoides]|uniref:uncharacterized protein n=1 Tax=Rasamsonia byssochlamydoides TaxID=89139 RepID=UPI003743B34E
MRPSLALAKDIAGFSHAKLVTVSKSAVTNPQRRPASTTYVHQSSELSKALSHLAARAYFCDATPAYTAGLTNWANLVYEFEEVREYVFDQQPGFHSTARRLKLLKNMYPAKVRRNFPFSGGSQNGLSSRPLILKRLPSRHAVEALVANYMHTFEKIYRLLHPPTFQEELSRFWQNPTQESDAWISQLFIILSLSCQSAPQHVMDAAGSSRGRLVSTFLESSEVILMHSSFLDFPDLTVIRTLCMMAIAKDLDIATVKASGGLWALLGLIVRLAMSISLHRDPTLFPTTSVLEAEMRRRVWYTILLLD